MRHIILMLVTQVLVLTSGDVTIGDAGAGQEPRAQPLSDKRTQGPPGVTHGKCEPITIPLCANIGPYHCDNNNKQ